VGSGCVDSSRRSGLVFLPPTRWSCRATPGASRSVIVVIGVSLALFAQGCSVSVPDGGTGSGNDNSEPARVLPLASYTTRLPSTTEDPDDGPGSELSATAMCEMSGKEEEVV